MDRYRQPFLHWQRQSSKIETTSGSCWI